MVHTSPLHKIWSPVRCWQDKGQGGREHLADGLFVSAPHAHTETLTSDFPASGLREIACVIYKLPGLRHFF